MTPATASALRFRASVKSTTRPTAKRPGSKKRALRGQAGYFAEARCFVAGQRTGVIHFHV